MKYLVVTIECILFLIFIAYLALGIFLVSEIKDNPTLLIETVILFVMLLFGAIYLACYTVKSTLLMFANITDGPIAFLRKKIKQDKNFILLIWLTIVELLITLFCVVAVSASVYISIAFNTDDAFFGSLANLPDTIITNMIPYLACLACSYFVLKKFLKVFIKNSCIKSNITITILVLLIQIILNYRLF